MLPNGDGFWIGLSDEAREDTFVWNDGTTLEFFSYQDWRPHQPDDFCVSEDCVEMFKNSGWNDIKCDSKKQYVCQYEETNDDEAVND